MTVTEKIQTLKDEYRTAAGTNRKVLQMRIKLLLWSIEKKTTPDDFEKTIRDALL